MTMTFDQAQALATAAFEAYTLPETMVVEDSSGMSAEYSAVSASFSKPLYFYSKEDDNLLENDENSSTSTAYFNAEICLKTGEIKDAYVIVSAGGNLIGDFSDENRRQAYEDAGLTEFYQDNSPRP